jgi:uncharacterized protein (DUF924 family)
MFNVNPKPSNIPVAAQDLLEFWFSADVQPLWFHSTPKFDHEIKCRFEHLWQQLQKDPQSDRFTEWSQTPEGVLALCILFDQLPLNMYRGESSSFQTESLAIDVAKQGITNGFDQQIAHDKLMFFYMPLMHSEKLEDQNQSVALFSKAGLIHNLRFAQHHQRLIKRFGRFPHRNAILGRNSTQDEMEYLDSKVAFRG